MPYFESFRGSPYRFIPVTTSSEACASLQGDNVINRSLQRGERLMFVSFTDVPLDDIDQDVQSFIGRPAGLAQLVTGLAQLFIGLAQRFELTLMYLSNS